MVLTKQIKTSEEANFQVTMGYSQPDFDGLLNGAGIQDDGAVGAYGRLEIKF